MAIAASITLTSSVTFRSHFNCSSDARQRREAQVHRQKLQRTKHGPPGVEVNVGPTKKQHQPWD